jgi:hypothetical protein
MSGRTKTSVILAALLGALALLVGGCGGGSMGVSLRCSEFAPQLENEGYGAFPGFSRRSLDRADEICVNAPFGTDPTVKISMA